MNSYDLNLPKQKPSTSDDLVSLIMSYRSTENRRLILRKALARKPNDAKLHQIRHTLTSEAYIRKGMKKGVFINYSRRDELLALDIAEALQDAGVSVWLDMFEIDRGRDWEGEIRRAIREYGMMVSILSPEALEDDHANRERYYFNKTGKLILPVISEPCDHSGWDFWLDPVDFTRGTRAGLRNLYAMLNVDVVMV